MKYIKSLRYDPDLIRAKIMGPNPLKLTEELLEGVPIPAGATVLDLGCGQGITSVFLAQQYGFRVFATDLWSDPADNLRFFNEMGLTTDQIIPIHADANDLPYARGFFDAIVSTDSYHYFGTRPGWLEEHILPYVRSGGYVCLCFPGMKRDLHDDLPKELLLFWTPEDLDTIHDAAFWRRVIGQPEGAEVLAVREMESNEEVWADWLECDNDYARGDRRVMEAGGGKYLNFISVVLRKL